MSTFSKPPPKLAITSGGRGLPSRLVLYGVPAIGKTSFAAYAPKPIFAMSRGENGLEVLCDNGLLPPVDHFPEIDDWQTLLQALEYLNANDTGHKTFVLDTLNGAERLCHEFVVQDAYRGSWYAFQDFGKGYERALVEWNKLLGLLHKLNTQRRMAIILLAHCRVKTYKNPTGPDYDRFSTELHDKSWAVVEKWADIVLFGAFETFVSKDGMRTKAADQEGARYLYTRRTACYDAKNRLGLPTEISMGKTAKDAWNAFAGHLREAKKRVQPAETPPHNGKKPYPELPGDIIMQPKDETETYVDDSNPQEQLKETMS